MSLTALKALALAKKYTKDTIEGAGAVAGKPCQIQSITDVTGGKRVTFLWVDNSNVEHTSTMDVKDGENGKGIKTVTVNANNHLVITYTDDTTYDAGEVKITAKVNSVNGKTGDVTLSTSDLDNDSDFVSDSNYVHTDNNYDATAKALVDGMTAALAEKADADDVIDGASYDSTNHRILFTKGATTLFSLDAAAFVKDGMVDTVEISSGNLVITFNTDAGKQSISIPLTDIFDPTNYYNKTQTDSLLADKADNTDINGVYEVMGKNGAKNLIEYPYIDTTKTISGVAYTDNGDGTITANGTPEDVSTFQLWHQIGKPLYLDAGNYILSDGLADHTGTCIDLYNYVGGTATRIARTADGTEARFTLTERTPIGIYIRVYNNVAVSNIVFKPMLRLAEDTDSTWQPYVPINHDLVSWKVNGKLGAKNLLPYPYQAGTVTNGGVTFTDNGDGSITVNGTAGENGAYYNCHNRTQGENNEFILPNGRYIVSGCPSDGSSSSYQIQVGRTHNGTFDLLARDTGNGAMFIANGDDFSNKEINPAVNIIIMRNTTVNNLTFYPMLRYAEDTDSTYQPYAKTNKQLTDEKLEEVVYEEEVHGVNLNSMPYYNGMSKTMNGVTFIVNSDGSITANGTATGGYAFFACHYRVSPYGEVLTNGKYIMSGCTGGSLSTYFIGANSTKNGANHTIGQQFDEEKEITLDGDDYYTDKTNVGFYFQVQNGQTVSNVTVRPMIRKADIEDSTYRPYNEQAIQNQLNDKGVLGAKNLLPYPFDETSRTESGVTITDNGDGSVTFNGTCTNPLFFRFYNGRSALRPTKFIENGKRYIATLEVVSGTITRNSGNSNFVLRTYPGDATTPNENMFYETLVEGSVKIPFLFNPPSSYIYSMLWYEGAAGIVYDNWRIRPMIRLASDTDDTYQPYAMTNRELTKDMRYSTSEIDTGKKWIDGKTIYRKVVDCGNLPSATIKDVAHGITGIDTVVSIYGMANSPSLNTHFPLPYANTSSTEAVVILVIGANIHIVDAYDFSGYTAKVVLEYTKS